ncbi:hypothetical protein [Hymenobacter psychrophilus]|uniref:hypothetical protein n=1 Tax=Hymenobacter psychrophilus TaxID=651662 RepID=UPI0011149EB2|nr:hypothetical protein [Hymenobacter psychrophilus]
MDFFSSFVIISPFISAALASSLTYIFGTRAKRKELLYQNRIESFKQIAIRVSELKKYCIGQLAVYQGNEFSPFYELEGSGLTHRGAIANITEYNQIFLTSKSKKALENLINNISMICNAELYIASQSFDDIPVDHNSIYEYTLKQADLCLSIIYNELGLD